MIKRLLKKYKYPPEETAYALETVIRQYEQWTDNGNYTHYSIDRSIKQYEVQENSYFIAAESQSEYSIKKNR